MVLTRARHGTIERSNRHRAGHAGRALASLLARLARSAPARVFVVEGLAPPAPPELLRLHPDVQLVDSPRSATILLVAGSIPSALRPAEQRIHDAMATPRFTLRWRYEQEREDDVDEGHAPGGRTSGTTAEVARHLARLHAELVAGHVPSEPTLLPDVAPAEWRGIGPYGQGGTGMTGGVPYGRPMTETAPDRDGLTLDRLDVRVGPFFSPFPPGLVLAVGLQGDVVQQASVGPNPFARVAVKRRDDPFRESLAQPVSVTVLEMARARHHLRWLAHALRVQGLPALGLRALALSGTVIPGDRAPIVALRHLLERTRALALATRGVGVISAEAMHGRGLGPVARASGVAEDVRADDAAYVALGFEPLTQAEGDARARWRQRLAEAEQSVELAGRGGEVLAAGGRRTESPRGLLAPSRSPLDALLKLLPQLLPGMEWGDAITTIVSLDIDLRDLPPQPAPAADSGRAPSPDAAHEMASA